MGNSNGELMQEVYSDVASFDGLRRPIKVSFLERKLTRKLPTYKLHPNPEDEFTHPDVGPSFAIINNYVEKMLFQMSHELPPLDSKDPLVVEKLFPRGYLLLNGHHRWAAAKRIGVKRVPVELVNLTHEEDILKMMDRTNNTKRVSFDLDEVLIATGDCPKDEEPGKPWSVVTKERLKIGAPVLIHELQGLGYDVWVYTSSFKSEKYIRAIFKGYKVNPDGVINGVALKKQQNKESMSKVKEAMKNKYVTTLHIDGGHVLYTNKETKDYDYISLQCADSDWASKVIHVVKGMEEKNANE